jgi:hypothetical protein
LFFQQEVAYNADMMNKMMIRFVMNSVDVIHLNVFVMLLQILACEAGKLGSAFSSNRYEIFNDRIYKNKLADGSLS